MTIGVFKLCVGTFRSKSNHPADASERRQFIHAEKKSALLMKSSTAKVSRKESFRSSLWLPAQQ